MGFFREKVTVEAAMRLTLGACVRRDPHHALSAFDATGALPRQQLDATAAMLLPFEVATWHQLWMTYAGATVPEDELSRRFMISLALALQDCSIPPDQADELLGALAQSTEEYIRFIGAQPADSVIENGPYFFLCHRFSTLVMGDASLWEHENRLHIAQVFNLAKQSYEAANAAFTQLTREYRIVVS